MSETARLLETDINSFVGTGTLLLTIAITVLGGSFQFGYQLGAVNQPETKITKFIETNLKSKYDIEMTKFYVIVFWSLAVSALCVGGMLGGLTGCRIADKHGRRRSLIVAALFSISGEVLQGFTLILDSYFALAIGRFVAGIGCGIFTAVVPLYINEISPPAKRGFFGSLNQLMIIVGILVSQTLGLEFILGDENRWPLLLALSSITAVLLVIVLPFCPSSPYFLVFMKNDKQGAINSLKRLRGTDDVEQEIRQIYEEKALIVVSKATFKDLFLNEDSRRALWVALSLHISQQFSGINSVIFYSTSIFLMAGLTPMASSLATISLGVVQLITTLVAGNCIDRLGRRCIFLTSLSGCTASLTILTCALLYKTVWPLFSYVAVAAIILFVGTFGIGTGAIPWLMTPELFTQNYRDVGISLAILFNWMANVTVANLYPIMQNKMGVYSFLPFIVISGIFIAIIYKFCPETTQYKITKNGTYAVSKRQLLASN